MTDELDLGDSPFSDFLGFELLLEEPDRELLSSVRAFMNREVEPIINDYWTRAEFPHELIPQIAELGIAGLAYDGPGCPARGALVDGLVAMELARVDPSIGTFMGVHGGLAMGSVQLCGSDEQRERWL
ncbi:MAG: acyl-CoA dehydrogenase family protein, partial [Nocardioides sp.]